jgi:hypothetical protein
MSVSGLALQLLLRIRRDSDQREQDGKITARHLNALAIAHGMSAAARRKAINELIQAKLVLEVEGGFQDLHFAQWCKSSLDRREERKGWRTAKAKKKPGSVADSPPDSGSESTPDSETSYEASKGSISTGAASKPELPPPADALMNGTPAFPPSEVDSNMIVATWASLSGGQPTGKDRHHVGWWLTQYGHLGANAIAGHVTRVYQREVAKGNRISRLEYFDGAIREANDAAAKPSPRHAPVRGIGEIPEPESALA